jgi:hypothetical protein
MIATKPNNGDLVPPEDACPKCGEQNVDRLVWIDDDNVRCGTCGKRYRPGPSGGQQGGLGNDA